MLPIVERTLAPGVVLRAIQTSKFKTSLLSANFLVPLEWKTASKYSLLPRILRRGTRSHPDMESLSAALDDLYGGTIEPEVRKKGEVLCVGFWGSFLDDAFVPADSRILESAVALLGELILSPAGDGANFVPDYVKSEKENLLDRIRSQINDKRRYSLSRLREEMCRLEPYGVSTLGTAETARNADGDALWMCYQTMLERAPLSLYYCGSADPDRVEAAFRRAFAVLLRGERDKIPATLVVPDALESIRRFSDSMDVTQGKLALGFRTGGAFTGREEVARAMLTNAVFGGSTTSKLFMNVREKLSLCYFASSTLSAGKGVLFVSSGVEFANFQKAEDEILLQLLACQKGDITEEELEAARRYVINSIRMTLDAQGKLEEYWLNRCVAGTKFSPEALAEAVASVTMEQVVSTAGRISLDSIYRLTGKEG